MPTRSEIFQQLLDEEQPVFSGDLPKNVPKDARYIGLITVHYRLNHVWIHQTRCFLWYADHSESTAFMSQYHHSLPEGNYCSLLIRTGVLQRSDFTTETT